jgi:hypothetical protein
MFITYDCQVIMNFDLTFIMFYFIFHNYSYNMIYEKVKRAKILDHRINMPLKS